MTNLIKTMIELEGLRLKAYKDSVGFLTIGVGHCLTRDELMSGKLFIGEEIVRWQNGITYDEAIKLLEIDLSKFQMMLHAVQVPLTENQKIALVAFIFNIGIYAFRHSKLLRLLNENNYDAVPEQLRRWIYAGGKKNKGLTNRRKKEIEIWERINT